MSRTRTPSVWREGSALLVAWRFCQGHSSSQARTGAESSHRQAWASRRPLRASVRNTDESSSPIVGRVSPIHRGVSDRSAHHDLLLTVETRWHMASIVGFTLVVRKGFKPDKCLQDGLKK
jgi:hypothetical protein